MVEGTFLFRGCRIFLCLKGLSDQMIVICLPGKKMRKKVKRKEKKKGLELQQSRGGRLRSSRPCAVEFGRSLCPGAPPPA